MIRITRPLVLVIMLGLLPPATAIGQEDTSHETVHFVVDTSGSMSGNPLQEAKEALSTAVAAIPDTTGVGMRSYGGSCGDGGDLEVPIGTDNRSALDEAINGLSAGGGTPTDAALIAGVADLPAEGHRTIVLISDGQPTCGDVCPVAEDLVETEEVEFTVHTVGFAASGSNAEAMECIATATGGEYFEADDAEGLIDAIGSAVGGCTEDTHFVGIRGSGQEATDNNGLGPQIAELESLFRNNRRTSGLEITTYAVQYSAPGIEILMSDLFQGGRDLYFEASFLGAGDLERHLTRYVDECPGVPVVIAGYSSGALVARIALEDLPQELADAIAAVLLIGDPSRDPSTDFTQYGTADGGALGALTLVGVRIADSALTAQQTLTVCNSGDMVCDPQRHVKALIESAALGTGARKALLAAAMREGHETHLFSYEAQGDLHIAAGWAVTRVLDRLE